MTNPYLLFTLLVLFIQHFCIAFKSLFNGEFDFTSFFLNFAVGLVCLGVIVFLDEDYFVRLFTPREK